MKKYLLLLLTVLGCSIFANAGTGDNFIPVDAAHFPDSYFRTNLTNQAAYDDSDKTIDITRVTAIDISGEAYEQLASLEGINYFKELKVLFLPGKAHDKSSKNFKLSELKLEDLPKLEMIDNGRYYDFLPRAKNDTQSFTDYKYQPYKDFSQGYLTGTQNTYNRTTTSNISISCAVKKVTIKKCPSLKYLALMGYTQLESIELDADINDPSTTCNIESFFLGKNDALKSIDISNLPKLKNVLKTNNTHNTTISDLTSLYLPKISNTNYITEEIPSFGIVDCPKLTTFIIGNHPDLKAFGYSSRSFSLTVDPNNGHLFNPSSYIYDNISTLDLSGLTGLEYLVINNTETNFKAKRGSILLDKIIWPKNGIPLKYLQLHNTRMHGEFDITPFANTLEVLDLQYNHFNSIDITKLPKADVINVKNNCIFELGLPPVSTTIFEYEGNRIIYLPDPTGKVNSSLNCGFANQSLHLQVRNIPQDVNEYKITDDSNFIKRITGNKSGGSNIDIQYTAPKGGKFGSPDDSEHPDPTVFYFDNTHTVDGAIAGEYFFEFLIGGTSVSRKGYCKVILKKTGWDSCDEEYWSKQETPTKGGLIQSVTTHYGGIGEVPQTKTITWVSGRIHDKEGESDMKYNPVDFDPEDHHIDFPDEINNKADELKLAKDNVSVSLIVELSPDEHSENCSALVCIDIIDNNGKMTPLLNKEEIWEGEGNDREYKGDRVISDTPIFYQVYPETEETAKPLNVATIDEEETEHNESSFVSGTTSDFEADYTWNHPEVAAKTATVEIPIANQIWKAYQTMNNKSGTIGQVRTYVLEEPTILSTDAAVKLVNGTTDAPKYLYMVAVPLSVDDNVVTGVGNISSDSSDNSNAPVEYYTITGVRTDGTAPGLYIRRQGNTATKVLVK